MQKDMWPEHGENSITWKKLKYYLTNCGPRNEKCETWHKNREKSTYSTEASQANNPHGMDHEYKMKHDPKTKRWSYLEQK